MNLKFLQFADHVIGWFFILMFKPVIGLSGILLRRNHDITKEFKHIVVLKIKGGGSLFLAKDSMLAIRKNYPNAQMTLIASSGVAKFGDLLSIFDRNIIINDATVFSLFISVVKSILFCWRNPVDVFIDLEVYSKLTGIFAVLTLARNRFGFYLNEAFFRKGIYTHLLFLNQNSLITFYYEGFAELLKCPAVTCCECRESLINVLAENHISINKKYENTSFFVVAPFCSELGRGRIWSLSRWALLLTKLLTKHKLMSVCIIGCRNDLVSAESLLSNIPESLMSRINLECGSLSLPEACSIMQKSSVFIGIDSGPLHLARCYGNKIISLWGATNPATRLKKNDELTEHIIYSKPACSPCVHIAEQAPCIENNVCMQNIDVDLVYKSVNIILKKKKPCYQQEIIEDSHTGIWSVKSCPFKYL